MRKILLIAAAALALVALTSKPAEVRAGSPCTVPASWGRLAGMATLAFGVTGYVFEAADGSVRMIPGNCSAPPKTVDFIQRSAD